MITGLAGTAVELEDFDDAAFDLHALLQKQAQQERKNLTFMTILEDLDLQHLENVNMVYFLHALISHVPQLSTLYRKELADFSKDTLKKKPIPERRRTKIIPLATNSANEMNVQGMKEGILDFLSTQMGITRENLGNNISLISGDGKTFNMLLLLKKMAAPESNDFDAFRWLVPLLELWHTKWTDLSRIVRMHWGTLDDPSSLATIAQLAECPTPSDMKKVDFFQGSHLVNLALDAHLLNCWE